MSLANLHVPARNAPQRLPRTAAGCPYDRSTEIPAACRIFLALFMPDDELADLLNSQT
jgi:hypothetical protein